jgi:hypothetical protein
MELKEYRAQRNPVRFPTVFLKHGEYIKGITISVWKGMNKEKRTQVWINGYPYEYCLMGDRLYTTDSDGNPKNLSVFRIKK